MKDERAYLLYISESIADIFDFTAGGREAFMSSKMIQAATLYKLQTLADAATHLSDEVKGAHPNVDWVAIRGFRNRLAHDYMGTNLSIAWNIIENNLASLKSAVDVVLNTTSTDDEKA